MRVFLCGLFPLLLAIAGIVFAPGQRAAGGKSVVRGRLSDETCAGGRASSETYTGTNPHCAKSASTKARRSS